MQILLSFLEEDLQPRKKFRVLFLVKLRNFACTKPSLSARLLSREAILRLEDIELFGLWGRNHSRIAEKC